MTIWTIETASSFAYRIPTHMEAVGGYGIPANDAEFIRAFLISRGAYDAVLTSDGGRSFCLKDGYLFDLDYDPNEFFTDLPLWQPHGEKK